MASKRVLVIGAAGNLGTRLVQEGMHQGHAITALVRDAKALGHKIKGGLLKDVHVFEGDIRDVSCIDKALDGQDIVVNAAGNVNDGVVFSTLFDCVVSAVKRHPHIEKSWFLAGAAVLTIPHSKRIGVGLPFVPSLYEPHRVNWQLLERSNLDWLLMCPGPMTAAATGMHRNDLRVSIDSMPFDIGTWTRFAPPLALSLVMKAKLPELIVPYEGVAAVIMANIAAGGRFSRHRVGIALPAGERGVKAGWKLGQRGPDA